MLHEVETTESVCWERIAHEKCGTEGVFGQDRDRIGRSWGAKKQHRRGQLGKLVRDEIYAEEYERKHDQVREEELI
jgi:hypothetical protein